jgi:formate transporter
MDQRISAKVMLRNWTCVYVGNLIGSVFYAGLFYLAITSSGATDGAALGEQVRKIAQAKTLAYAGLGGAGWGTAFIKAMLCNWMVTVGTILAFTSRSTIGKIAAMWLPITIFFAHGYEHSIVNMFVIPAGILLGAPVLLGQWWFWNQIPVTLGNIVAGSLFTGIALWYTYARKQEPARNLHALRSAWPSRREIDRCVPYCYFCWRFPRSMPALKPQRRRRQRR